jgi:diguanylate cyclase (GGDEF)-like protein
MSSLSTYNIQPIDTNINQKPVSSWVSLGFRLILVTSAITYFYTNAQTNVLILLAIAVIYLLSQSLLIWLNDGLLFWQTLISSFDMFFVWLAIACDPSAQAYSVLLLLPALILSQSSYEIKQLRLLTQAVLVITVSLLLIKLYFQKQALTINFGAYIILVIIHIGGYFIALKQYKTLSERAAQSTETDTITGLGNRWTLYESAKYLFPYHQRNMIPIMLMLIEVDITKSSLGLSSQQQKDHILKQFAAIASNQIRGCDIATRYAETEFAFLLLDTHHKEAESIALEIQQKFAAWALKEDLKAHAHIGLSPIPSTPTALDQILINLSHTLHRARQMKRNIIGPVFSDPTYRKL